MKKLFSIFIKIMKNPKMIISYIYATGLLNLLSDKTALKILWWSKNGKKLNLEEPKTYNEKIQWIKLNIRNPKLTNLVDKYKVREYITNLIGSEYLIPLLGSWKYPQEINYNNLPDSFVLKCNHNAGVGLYICRNKSNINIKNVNKNLNKGLSENFYYKSREWAYKNVERRIICEQYMEDGFNKSLRDYKFFCFNNKAKFIYISEGLEDHSTAKISFYDLEGNEMPFHRADYNGFAEKPIMPSNLGDMIKIANKIAKDINIPFVRVDLYSIQNKVYFSEITLYPNSGYVPFVPSNWDEILGSWIDLNTYKT